MKSHAVVFTAPNRVSYEPIESADPTPTDVVVEVHHSWIGNGTEGSFLQGERISGDVAWRAGDPAPFSMVAGYQKVGRVLEVGADVKGFAQGDWVFASMSRVLGMFDNRFAGHVSPAVCHFQAVHRLPEGKEPLAYAGLVLTQVGFNCGTRPTIESGQIDVVVGDGLVGQWAGQTLAQRGANVVTIRRHAERLARFRPDGRALLAGNDHGMSALKALALGPVQALVETVGDVSVLSRHLPSMNRGGNIVVAGFYRPTGAVNLQENLQAFRNSELSFHLVSGATRERMDETLRWVTERKLDTIGCLTHCFPVEDADKAWRLIQTKHEPVLGVVLDWPASRQIGGSKF